MRHLLGILTAVLLAAAPALAQNGKEPKNVEVTILSPVDGAVVQIPVVDVAVEFSAHRITSIDLLANGAVVATFDVSKKPAETSHTFPNVDLSGSVASGNPVSLVARALLGKQEKFFVDSAVVRVQVGSTPGIPPAPVIVSPASASILNTPSPAVTGTSSEAGLTIAMLVDGNPNGTTTSGAGGNWSLTPAPPLAEGLRTLTATATNGAGTSPPSAAVTVRIDTVPPVVSAPQPGNGTSTPNATPLIGADWSDPAPASGLNTATAQVRVDNVLVGVTFTATGFTFTPAPLSQGQHNVSAQISDFAGNTGSIAWSFTVLAATETTPPVISALSPANGSFTGIPTPTISALVTDFGGSGMSQGGVQLVVNGIVVNATVDQINTDQVSVSFVPAALLDGNNTFTVHATDNAGNAAVPATSVFAVDTTGPNLVVTFPVHLSTSTSTTTTVDALATDGVGLSVGSIHVTLNTVDVTPTLTLDQGPLTPSGAPGSVHITGTVQSIVGQNSMVFTAADRVGHSISVGRSYTVEQPPPPPLPSNIQLIKISGDGQEGLQGTATQQPLVVQAVDAANGNAPVKGLQLSWKTTAGGGVPVKDKGLVTNGGGIASFHFTFGARETANSVSVGIVGHDTVSPVEFSLTSRRPVLTDLSNQRIGLCNQVPSTSEYAGSALPKLLIFKLTDQGQPLKGETVIPFVSMYQNIEPTDVDLGYFLPSRGVTNANGEVTFAFVINPFIGDFGPFKLRIQAPSFVEADGEPVHADVPGEVKDPSLKPKNLADTEINYDDVARSGQGQVGIPGERIGMALRGRFFAPGFPSGGGAIIFSIVEGDGTFEPGDEGTFAGFLPDQFCGKIRLGMRCDAAPEQGRASAYFKLAPGTTHALIRMEGFTDVFAIGPPEVRMVQSTDPSNALVGVLIDDPSDPNPDAPFLIEALMPVGYNQAVTAKVESFDPLGAKVVDPNPVAPSEIQGISLTVAGTHPLNRHRFMRSGVLSGSNATVIPNQPVPSFQGQVLQMVQRGWFTTEIQAANVIQPALQTKPAEITRESTIEQAAKVGPNDQGDQRVHLDIANLPVVKLAGNAQPRYKWTIERVGGAKTPLKVATGSELFVTFGPYANATDQTALGLWNEHVKLILPVANANRRAIYTATVTGPGLPAGNNALKIVIPMSLGVSKSAAGAPAPPATKAGLTTLFTPLVVNLTGFAGLNEMFDTKTALQIWIDKVSPAQGLEHDITATDRLVYLGSDGKDANALGITVSPFATNFAPPKAQRSDLTITLKPVAVGLTTKAEELDLLDLTETVKHEVVHVNQGRGTNAAAALQKKIFDELFNQLFELPVVADRETNLDAFFDAASKIEGAFKELEAYSVELANWTGAQNQASLDLLKGLLGVASTEAYLKIVTFLSDGIDVTLANGNNKNLKLKLAATKTELITFVNTKLIGPMETFKLSGHAIMKASVSQQSWDTGAASGAQTADDNPTKPSFRKVK